MIIIGSKALLFRLNMNDEVIQRFAKSDYDVIMSVEDFTEWSEKNREYIKSLVPVKENKFKAIVSHNGKTKKYEIEVGFEGTSSKFLLDNVDTVTDFTGLGFLSEKFRALNLEYQLLTKKSHLIYPVHFEKNINDYHLIKSMVGEFELDETMQEYFKLRSDEAKARYKQRTPKLNITTEDFFNSKLNVPHYFVHDDIHEVMAHHDEPVYKKMQPDPTMAWCAKDMFFALPYEMQVQSMQEEAYVIALERYIVPQYGENWTDFFTCYKNALKRICTTLCSGWFREFALENYPEAIKRYNPFFVDILRKAVLSKEISPIEGKTYDDLPDLLTFEFSSDYVLKGSEAEYLAKYRINVGDLTHV